MREEFESMVKKIKLNCVTKAARILLKHKVAKSIICEAFEVDETVLESLEDESERYYNCFSLLFILSLHG